MTAAASAAILAGIGISPAFAEPLSHEDFEIDRELRMRISNGFTTQIWAYGGQVWRETQDTLCFHEDERVRISIRNDTPFVRVVTVGHDRVLRIRPRETASIDLTIASLEAFSIDVVGLPAFSRPARIRANYGAHANVI
jgi:FtsP/CotA-like multicopper oxidase with cupredoxin domain